MACSPLGCVRNHPKQHKNPYQHDEAEQPASFGFTLWGRLLLHRLQCQAVEDILKPLDFFRVRRTLLGIPERIQSFVCLQQ
jgi:hypothetical protein